MTSRQQRYRERYPERVVESKRRYRESHREDERRRSAAYRVLRPGRGAAYAKEYKERNRDQLLAARRSLEGHARVLFNGARGRARTRGLQFDLTLEWVLDHLSPMVCEATGITLVLKDEDDAVDNLAGPWTPSIDRIDSNLGYTTDNARIVCWMFNRAKGRQTDGELLLMARALVARSDI